MPEGPISACVITDETYLLVCAGDVGKSSRPSLASHLGRLVAAGAREIVVDLTEVRTIDSTSLRGLAATGRRASSAGTVTTLACDDEHVLWFLRVVGLERHFRVEQTVTEAFVGVAKRARRAASVAA